MVVLTQVIISYKNNNRKHSIQRTYWLKSWRTLQSLLHIIPLWKRTTIICYQILSLCRITLIIYKITSTIHRIQPLITSKVIIIKQSLSNNSKSKEMWIIITKMHKISSKSKMMNNHNILISISPQRNKRNKRSRSNRITIMWIMILINSISEHQLIQSYLIFSRQKH